MRAKPVEPIPSDLPILSLEDWGDLGPEESGELVHGQITEVEIPDATHETVVLSLAITLAAWGKDHDAKVLPSGMKYGLAEGRGRMPDVTVFLSGRRPPARGVARIPPDIAIEVISPSPSDMRRDRVEKVSDYAAFGVRWYWLVDPGLRTFEVWELREGVYAHVGAASTGLVEDISGCPGLTVDLDALWAEVDELG